MEKFNYTWHVTSFDKDENGKPTYIHFALEGSRGETTTFTYGSMKIGGSLGIPDKFVTLAVLKDHLIKKLPENIKQRHLQEVVRKYLYSS